MKSQLQLCKGMGVLWCCIGLIFISTKTLATTTSPARNTHRNKKCAPKTSFWTRFPHKPMQSSSLLFSSAGRSPPRQKRNVRKPFAQICSQLLSDQFRGGGKLDFVSHWNSEHRVDPLEFFPTKISRIVCDCFAFLSVDEKIVQKKQNKTTSSPARFPFHQLKSLHWKDASWQVHSKKGLGVVGSVWAIKELQWNLGWAPSIRNARVVTNDFVSRKDAQLSNRLFIECRSGITRNTEVLGCSAFRNWVLESIYW